MMASMKLIDRSKPLRPEEWKFVFVAELRRLRPEIGERLATVHSHRAYLSHSRLQPEEAAAALARTMARRK